MKRKPSLRRSADAVPKSRQSSPRRRTASAPCALIPLNTAKIREQALRKHRKAENELARLTDQLKRYHEVDVPGFQAWRCRTFGPLLSDLREMAVAIQEKEAFVDELWELAQRFMLSEEEAYRELIWRRANPEAAAEKDRLLELQRERQRAEEEARRMERESKPNKRKGRKTTRNPFDFPETGDFDDLEDEQLFEEFISSMFGGAMPREVRPKPDKRQEKTAKELYRAIVLSLHPDHHGQMSESGKQLWNEAQQAYRAGDVESLQTVLAQCESGEAGLGNNTAVSVILNLIRKLKAAMLPVRSQLRQARRSFEWEFEKKIEDPRFVRKIESLLRAELLSVKRTLREITQLLETLKRRSTKKTRRKTCTGQSDSFFPGFDFPDEDLVF